MDLYQPDSPYKTLDEYVLNEDVHMLVVVSKLPRPSNFVEQPICVSKTLCEQLLDHEIFKSILIRGLSAFNPAVIRNGSEANHIIAIEK